MNVSTVGWVLLGIAFLALVAGVCRNLEWFGKAMFGISITIGLIGSFLCFFQYMAAYYVSDPTGMSPGFLMDLNEKYEMILVTSIAINLVSVWVPAMAFGLGRMINPWIKKMNRRWLLTS